MWQARAGAPRRHTVGDGDTFSRIEPAGRTATVWHATDVCRCAHVRTRRHLGSTSGRAQAKVGAASLPAGQAHGRQTSPGGAKLGLTLIEGCLGSPSGRTTMNTFLGQLKAMFSAHRSAQGDAEAYLGQATDRGDLERRMRELERRRGGAFSAHIGPLGALANHWSPRW